MVRLKQYRIEKGWTQRFAAEQIGISIDYVKKIESRGCIPSVKVLKKMADLFGCKTIDELLYDQAS